MQGRCLVLGWEELAFGRGLFRGELGSLGGFREAKGELQERKSTSY